MDTFKSPEVIVNRNAEDFFAKIGDLNNLKEIMPSQIEDFESSATTCSFKRVISSDVSDFSAYRVTSLRIRSSSCSTDKFDFLTHS